MKRLIPLITALMFTGCSVNPVTGDRDFITSSPGDDLKIGVENYQPMLQAQGGHYDVDPALIELRQQDKVPDTIRFMRFPPTALIVSHVVGR